MPIFLYPETIALILTAVANILLGVIVVARAYRRAYAWHFIGIIVSVALWATGDILILRIKSVLLIEIGKILFYVAPMLTPAFIWLFALIFPEDRRVSRKNTTLGLAYLAVAALITGLNTDKVAIIAPTNGLNVVTPLMPGFALYGLYLASFFGAAFRAQIHKMGHTKGIAHTQTAYAFYGIIVAANLAIVTNVLLPLAGVKNLIWLGPIFSLIGVSSIALAIIRFRLFDIRVAIIRSVTYAFSLITLTALYVVLVTVLSQVLIRGQKSEAAAFMVNIIVVLLVLPTYAPLTRAFRRFSNKLFYQDIYEPQAFIGQLNQSLAQNLELDKLLKSTSEIIANNLHAEYCVIGIKETPFRGLRILGTEEKTYPLEDIEQVRRVTPRLTDNVIISEYLPSEQKNLRKLLEKNDISVLVRIAPTAKTPHEGLGYIVLGRKKSGNLYGSQDIKMLDIISKELLIAIQNALHFEEIENFNITLQEKVDSATSKLRRTNRRLEELDNIKDDFISMASHQLRTPLTSVKGYLSMVIEGDAGRVNPQQTKMLNQAFTSAQRMVFLITDLLNVSRLKTGKFVIDAVPVNLSTTIQEEVEQLKETAEAKNIKLSYKKPAAFPQLMLDEVKTRQVLMNFMDNAIYYTPVGGHIQVELTEKPTTIELRVIDDGIGVPRSEQHHLFTKFYRATNARKARPDGTGLGLFMAAKVITAQGGSIIFSSREGKGSTFGFAFSKSRLRVPASKPLDAALSDKPVAKQAAERA